MKRNLMTAEIARNYLSYNKETGYLTYLERQSVSHIRRYDATKWNAKHAGKRACRLGHKGNIVVTLCDKVWLAHRIAWLIVTGEWPVDQIDHINGNRSDNRWCNLRAANNSQNHANVGLLSSNTSGLKGASWSKRYKKWVAQIGFNKMTIHLGRYDCPAAAHFAYLIAADKFFGEYARAA